MISFIGVGILAQKLEPQRMKSRDGLWQSFTVTCERRFGVGPEDRTNDVIDLAAFRQTALNDLKQLSIGDLVEVRGQVQSQTFSRKDGNASVFIRLHVESIQLLVKNFVKANLGAMDEPGKQESAPSKFGKEDDLPF